LSGGHAQNPVVVYPLIVLFIAKDNSFSAFSKHVLASNSISISVFHSVMLIYVTSADENMLIKNQKRPQQPRALNRMNTS